MGRVGPLDYSGRNGLLTIGVYVPRTDSLLGQRVDDGAATNITGTTLMIEARMYTVVTADGEIKNIPIELLGVVELIQAAPGE
jgi:hypothetical protein